MEQPIDSRAGRAGRIVAIIAGMLLMSVVTLTTSRAAFNDVTDNTGNSITSGAVALTDDDSGSAMFAVDAMRPGDSVSECINVTYDGTIDDPNEVVVYSGGYTGSQPFANQLLLTIEQGTGGTFGDCAEFVGSPIVSGLTVDQFSASQVSYATGAGDWAPTGESREQSYRITIELAPDVTNTLQGLEVTDLAFVWEVQS